MEKFGAFFTFRKLLSGDETISFVDKRLYKEVKEKGHYKAMNFHTFGAFAGKEHIKNYNANTFYTWSDTQYRDFMMQMLMRLEPRYEPAGTILVDELDEMTEIIFVYEGDINVGYEINKQKKYCFKFKDKCVIGSYGINFDQRACFIY